MLPLMIGAAGFAAWRYYQNNEPSRTTVEQWRHSLNSDERWAPPTPTVRDSVRYEESPQREKVSRRPPRLELPQRLSPIIKEQCESPVNIQQIVDERGESPKLSNSSPFRGLSLPPVPAKEPLHRRLLPGELPGHSHGRAKKRDRPNKERLE